MPDPAKGFRRRRTLEEARLKVDVSTRLTRLQKIQDRLLAETWGKEDAVKLGALKLEADIQFRLLAKVLPDLKQVDMTVFQEDMTVEDILHELRALVREDPALAALAPGIEKISAGDKPDSLPH